MAPTRPRSPRFVPLLLLLAACLALSACADGGVTSGSTLASTTAPSVSATPAASPPDAWPLTLADDTGRTVTLDAAPSRIVSLAPSNTEIACAVGACGALVGVTDFDDYPASVADLPKVVTNATVDPEKVVAARPDLVLAGGNGLTPVAVIDQLRGLGLRVMTLYPADLDGIYADIDLVGRALGRAGQAASLVDSMRSRVVAVQQAVAGAPRPRVFYEVSVYQGVVYTAGEGSFLASLIEMAGGDPVTGDARTTAIPLEKLVNADPELILLGDASYDPNLQQRDSALSQVRARPGWGVMTAVRDGRVVPYRDDIVTTRPGPRIVDGLEALARAIHPEAFNR